jgi:hypothetical protein
LLFALNFTFKFPASSFQLVNHVPD